MGLFDRFKSSKVEVSKVENDARTASGPVTAEQIIEVAQRDNAPATDVTHYFICSGNASLIDAFTGLLRDGTPGFGGHASHIGRLGRGSDRVRRKPHRAAFCSRASASWAPARAATTSRTLQRS